MAGEATPTDGRFRRGVYVMLVVLGILAAGGLIDARRSVPQVTAARDAARAAQADAAMARAQLNALKTSQADESRRAAERETRAVAQRREADAKLDALERFTAALLAASGTPDQRRTYTAIITSPAPSPSSTAPRAEPRPSPTATASPHPSSSPSASCRVYSPVSGRCVVPG